MILFPYEGDLDEVLDSKEDPYNKYRTRNELTVPEHSYNCMGYAFETFNWICPYEEGKSIEREERIRDLCIELNYDYDRVANILLEEYKEWIVENLEDVIPIRRRDLYKVPKNYYIVAMRVYVDEDFENEYDDDDCDFHDFRFVPDFDFHFLKCKGKVWSDKPGGRAIKYSNKQDWINTDGFTYNSKTAYFMVKCA